MLLNKIGFDMFVVVYINRSSDTRRLIEESISDCMSWVLYLRLFSITRQVFLIYHAYSFTSTGGAGRTRLQGEDQSIKVATPTTKKPSFRHTNTTSGA